MKRELNKKVLAFVIENEETLKRFSKNQLTHFLSYVRKVDGAYRAGHAENPKELLKRYIQIHLDAKIPDWMLKVEGKTSGEALIELLELESSEWNEVVKRVGDLVLLLEILIEGASIPDFSLKDLLC